ncbi:hypothetical protein MHYP_G00210460 [Metynnis hypsauchen]
MFFLHRWRKPNCQGALTLLQDFTVISGILLLKYRSSNSGIMTSMEAGEDEDKATRQVMSLTSGKEEDMRNTALLLN